MSWVKVSTDDRQKNTRRAKKQPRMAANRSKSRTKRMTETVPASQAGRLGRGSKRSPIPLNWYALFLINTPSTPVPIHSVNNCGVKFLMNSRFASGTSRQ